MKKETGWQDIENKNYGNGISENFPHPFVKILKYNATATRRRRGLAFIP
jgi:hypothetical protein